MQQRFSILLLAFFVSIGMKGWAQDNGHLEGNARAIQGPFFPCTLTIGDNGTAYSGHGHWHGRLESWRNRSVVDEGSWGVDAGSGPLPIVYDLPVEDLGGNAMLDEGIYPNPSEELAGLLQSDDLYINAPGVRAENGGDRGKLHAPASWSVGSSYSHWDEVTYNETENALMTPAIAPGETDHDVGPMTCGLFGDLGWVLGVGCGGGTGSATFDVTYSGFTTEARAAFQHAVDIWSVNLRSDVTIRVDAHFENLGANDLLGQAGPSSVHANFSGAPENNVWYIDALADALHGADNGSGDPDIVAQFNSEFENWYFGLDGNPGNNEFDFVSVVLHELGHGLGFLGSADVEKDVDPPPPPPPPEEFAVEMRGPNPVRTSTIIRILQPEPGPVRAELFDPLGRSVVLIFDGEANERLPLRINREGLAAGMYLLDVRAEGGQETLRITFL